MARKRTKRRKSGRESLHVTLDAELAARVRAKAGFDGRDVSDLVADGCRIVTKGFRVSQETTKGERPSADGLGVVGEQEAA